MRQIAQKRDEIESYAETQKNLWYKKLSLQTSLRTSGRPRLFIRLSLPLFLLLFSFVSCLLLSSCCPTFPSCPHFTRPFHSPSSLLVFVLVTPPILSLHCPLSPHHETSHPASPSRLPPPHHVRPIRPSVSLYSSTLTISFSALSRKSAANRSGSWQLCRWDGMKKRNNNIKVEAGFNRVATFYVGTDL